MTSVPLCLETEGGSVGLFSACTEKHDHLPVLCFIENVFKKQQVVAISNMPYLFFYISLLVSFIRLYCASKQPENIKNLEVIDVSYMLCVVIGQIHIETF